MATLKKQTAYTLDLTEQEAILINTLLHHTNSDGEWGGVAEDIFSVFYNEKVALDSRMLPQDMRENGLTLKDTSKIER